MSSLSIETAKRSQNQITDLEEEASCTSPTFSIIQEVSDLSIGASINSHYTASRKSRSFSEGNANSSISLTSVKSIFEGPKEGNIPELKKSNLNPNADDASRQGSKTRRPEKSSKPNMLEHGSHMNISAMLQDISSTSSQSSLRGNSIPRTTSFDRSYSRRASIGVISSGNIEIEKWEHKPDIDFMEGQFLILQDTAVDDNRALPALKKIWSEINRHETIPSYADTLFDFGAIEILNNLVSRISSAQSHSYICVLLNYIITEADGADAEFMKVGGLQSILKASNYVAKGSW